VEITNTPNESIFFSVHMKASLKNIHGLVLNQTGQSKKKKKVNGISFDEASFSYV